MPKATEEKTFIRTAREDVSHTPSFFDAGSSSQRLTRSLGPSFARRAPSPLDLSLSGPGNVSQAAESSGPVSSTSQQRIPKLAPSLSGRQLLNQRLQKYKLPAIFRANLVGPAQAPRWKGSFWIKDTMLGTSNLEHSKAAAKEGAAMSALKWLNTNHYY